jgi:predicted Zn-dependent protease
LASAARILSPWAENNHIKNRSRKTVEMKSIPFLERRFAVAVISFFLFSCATTKLPPVGSSNRPFQMEEEEQRLWKDADHVEKKLEKSHYLHKDPQLDTYLNNLAQKLLPSEVRAQNIQLRVRVLKNPFLNAFVMPNGAIYIHTGMLARLENEAQLATILGHEIVHFLNRHTVKEMRDTENKNAFLQVMQLLVGSTGWGSLIVLALYNQSELWTLASVRGYSRELETEADEGGLKAMVRAGYDPEQAPRTFENLTEGRDEEKIEEPFFFGTHPRLQERINNYRKLLSKPFFQSSKGGLGSVEYEKMIQGVLLDNALMDMDIGRFRFAQKGIERRLKRNSEDPRGHFLMGELYRRSVKGDSENLQKAIAEYQKAISFDPNYAEPHRELGLVYQEQKQEQKARAEFELYLLLNPQAVDAPIIKGYLNKP